MSKVSIIGGGGLVGSHVAYELQSAGVVDDVVLLDANKGLADGQARDLNDGSAYVKKKQRITGGDYDEIPSTDVVVITAGHRRKPDEQRLALINRNVVLFRSILAHLKAAGLKDNAVVHVVSNPVDILTHLAATELEIDPNRVVGLGTMLDTARFRSHIGAHVNVSPADVSAMIVGEHGDSMVPLWSKAFVGEKNVEKMDGMDEAAKQAIITATKTGGAQVIKLTEGVRFAVARVVAEVIHAIIQNTPRILPISSLQTGDYGIRDISISVPTLVNGKGIHSRSELPLRTREVEALRASAEIVKDTLRKVPST